MVIHRLTGDGPKKSLLAPLWTGDKKRVLNELNRALDRNKIQQGNAKKPLK
jgi:radical SAM superfamily enzyme